MQQQEADIGMESIGMLGGQSAASIYQARNAKGSGELVDINERLMKMAMEYFSKFRSVLEDLRSGDTGRFLDAPQEITEKPAQKIREAIENMKNDEIAAFATSLAKVTGSNAVGLLQCTREIHDAAEQAV